MFHAKKMDHRIFDIFYIRAQNQLHTTNIELNKIICAATNGHIVIFKSYVQEPIGYLIFARVNSCTLNMIKMNFGEIAYPYEWRSGRIIFVVDLVLSKQQITFAREQLLSYLKSVKIAAFFKRGKVSLVYRGRIIKRYPLQNIGSEK